MAHNSRCWVQRTWRKGARLSSNESLRSGDTTADPAHAAEDLIAYQYRLLLEYARIESGGAWGDFDDSSL